MAAITPSSISADTAHGQQFLGGGEIRVFPFTLGSTSDSWDAPNDVLVTSVAWKPTTTADAVSVTITSGGNVALLSNSGGETGQLVVVMTGSV